MVKFTKIIILILLAALTSVPAAADSMEAYYRLIGPGQSTKAGARIEVVEIFWYGCPRCYAFEPYLQNWLASKPDNVDFRLMPGMLNSRWVHHARAFYISEYLGVHDQIHSRLFNAIHQDGKNIFERTSIREFFIEQGIDAGNYDRAYNSSEVNTSVRYAYDLQTRLKIRSVPTIIINGKYITSPAMAGSFENLVEVIAYLVDKESS